MFQSSYRNTVLNQSACVFAFGYLLNNSIIQIGSSVKTDPELVILPDGFDKNNVLHIKLDNEGCFNAVVRYNGVLLNQGQLTVISLNCMCLLLCLC